MFAVGRRVSPRGCSPGPCRAGDPARILASLTTEKFTGEAAGVPFVAVPPDGTPNGAPSVVIWHLLDPPRSEIAMQAAIPLAGLPAWRVYLGLPMSGSRLPEGGLEAFFQLGYEDAVLQQFEPIVLGAVTEFPAALADLRERLGIGPGPLGLVGGSAGALVALSVLTDTDVAVSAVALVSPATRLASIVAANERRFEVTYPWSEKSRAVAAQLDFVAIRGGARARTRPSVAACRTCGQGDGRVVPPSADNSKPVAMGLAGTVSQGRRDPQSFIRGEEFAPFPKEATRHARGTACGSTAAYHGGSPETENVSSSQPADEFIRLASST